MRDYGMVSPRFWIGKTGKTLRKNPYAQRVALYLMTAPSSEMTGVFYCPLATILNDVGSPSEGALLDYEGALASVKEALETLRSLDFCVFDEESDFVFVKEMAHWQIAEKLKPSDKRVKGVLKYVESMPEPLRTWFIERYNDDFSLGFTTKSEEKEQAPSKPLASQKQEQEQEQDIYEQPDGCSWSTPAAPTPELALNAEEEKIRPVAKAPIPYQRIVDLYNAKLGPYLRVCKVLNPTRRSNIRARWTDVAKAVKSTEPEDIINGFSAYFDKVARSDFLMGKCPTSPGHSRPFSADFDWIMNSKNYTSIYEGKYENGRKPR